MRKINAIVSALLIALFLFHGIAGALILLGVMEGGTVFVKAMTHFFATAVAIHVIIGIKLTADTIKAGSCSGHFYARENRIFLARRISGFSILIFIIPHMAAFMGIGGKEARLRLFGRAQLIASILLVLSILVHLLTNIRAMLISFGISGFRIYLRDVLFVLSVVLLLMGVAFAVYYLRWNVLWR